MESYFMKLKKNINCQMEIKKFERPLIMVKR